MDDAAWDAAIQRRAVDSLAFEAEIALRKDRAALKAERDALRERVEALEYEENNLGTTLSLLEGAYDAPGPPRSCRSARRCRRRT